MNALAAELAPYVHALGWSLLHFLWQGALIGLAYALLRRFCPSSAARHRFGMLCLLAMLACLLVTLALLWPACSDMSISFVGPAIAVSSASIVSARSTGLEAWLPWCVGVWLVGVCAIALRSFLHWRRLAAIVRSATALPRDWQLRLITLRQRFGILRPVCLLASFAVATPTLIGSLRPTILLPMSLLSGFTPAQIELILAHELAHVRRFDYIANLIQVVVETLLFYHPAVHWICADVRQQREQSCDDLVLGLGGERLAYARTLAELEEWMQDESARFGAAIPALGAGGGVLLARVRRIVDSRAAAPALQARGNGMTLPVLLAGAGLMLAMLRLHSPSVEALGAALVRATATSAELLSAASFRIRADASMSMSPIRPVPLAVALPRREIEHVEPAAMPLPPRAVARIEASAAKSVPPTTEGERDAIAKPAVSASVEAPAAVAVAPVPVVAAASTTAGSIPAVAASGPQALHAVPPVYPLDALRNGVAGKVDLEFQIDGEGRVRDIRVLSAQPAGVFEQAAIAALRQWRYSAPVTSMRYTRSFAFARGEPAQEGCHQITGSHICRKSNADGEVN